MSKVIIEVEEGSTVLGVTTDDQKLADMIETVVVNELNVGTTVIDLNVDPEFVESVMASSTEESDD